MSYPHGRFPLVAALLLFLHLVTFAPVIAAQEETQLVIISPSNGEIFYASKLGYIVAIPITGKVTVPDGTAEEAVVSLTIHSAHAAPIELTTHPDDTGFFRFNLDLNPENIPLPSVGERYFDYSVHCPDCHFSSEAALPLGQIQLEITAVHPTGGEATAERHVTVDRSQRATLPVQVILDGDAGFSLEHIPVQAETRLYEWRGRISRASTDANGRVELDVEALTQRDTHYLVSVPPTMIDNLRYQSTEPQEIVIAPGMQRLATITLAVMVENGTINGRLGLATTLPGKAAGATVLAIAEPSGLLYSQPLEEDSTFSFDRLPLGKYLVTAQAEDETAAWATEPAHVDITEETTAEIALPVVEKPRYQLRGRLVDESGQPIPFGWLAGPDGGYVGRVSPFSGSFSFITADDTVQSLQAKAPGYWSQPVSLDTAGEQEFIMQPRSDRRTIDWGDGQIFVPAESVVVETEDTLSLVRGWLWGHNAQADPLVINLEGSELEMQAADFALEYAPGEVSWLYVNDGEVTFTTREGSSQQIVGGQMMALGDGVPRPSPVIADERVVTLFRVTREPTVELPFTPAPTAAQRFDQGVSRLGQRASQIVVGATYLLMLIAPLVALLYAIRYIVRLKY